MGTVDLSYELGTANLGVSLTATAPGDQTLDAPLRLRVDDPGQVVSGRSFDVGVDSTTTLAIDVATATARPAVDDTTGTASRATLALGNAALVGPPSTKLQAGIAERTVSGSGNNADLDVTVTTSYDGTAGALETVRSTEDAVDGSGHAAVAHLVSDAGTIDYSALPTDSSGGAGAAQPEPEAMEVKYLAEGLDGLAAALGEATDGAAPANLREDGSAVSAPLIGSNLDAGADVAEILTGLTRELRTELDLPVTVDTAEELVDALDDAVAAGVNAAPGLEDIAATNVEVSMTCTDDDECEPVCEVPAGETEEVCTSLGSTEWETVSITTELTGSDKTGETPFDSGLPGLALNSDKVVETATSWTLPITLELVRGVGPQIRINDGDALELKVGAQLPTANCDGVAGEEHCLEAIVGYLPAQLSADGQDGELETNIVIEPEVPAGDASATYDLFQLYDGELTAQPSFVRPRGSRRGGAQPPLRDVGRRLRCLRPLG